MKIIFCILFTFLSCNFTFGQVALNNNSSDSNTFIQKADSLVTRGKYLSAVKIYKKALSLLPENFRREKGLLHYDIGFSFQNSRSLDSALYYYKKGDKLLKDIETSGLRYQKNYNLSSYHFAKLDIDSAMYYGLEALYHAEKSKDPKKIAISSKGVGRIFLTQLNFEKARYYFETGKNFSLRTTDTLLIADCEVNLGALALEKKEYTKAESKIKKALEYYKSSQHAKGIITSQSYLVKILFAQGKLVEASKMSGPIINMMQEFEYTDNFKKVIENTAKIKELDKDEQSTEAIEEAKQIISTNINLSKANSTKIAQNISLLKYINKTDLNKDLLDSIYPKKDISKTLDVTLNLQDSLYQAALENNYLELETKYQTEKKEKENLKLRALNTEKELDLIKKERLIILSTSLALIGLIAGISIYISANKKKRKLIMQNQLQIIKAKDAQSNKIAMQLHDGNATRLKELADILASKNLNILGEELKEMGNNIRDLSYQLKKISFKDSELNKQLITLACKYDSETLDIRLSGHNDVNWTICDDAIKRNIHIIISQALINIKQHANASQVIINFKQMGKKLNISIKDDGRGFEMTPENFGVGLTSMKVRVQELNGKINFDSQEKKGTSILIQLTLA